MTEFLRASRSFVFGAALILALSPPAHGQVIDARLVPAGVLRIGFLPQYQSWDRLFAEDGSVIPLGKYLSSDSAGSDIFPSLAAPEAATRTIIGNPSYRLSLGALTTRVDADVRRFPFELSVGVNSRLTLTATVPIVVTRVNAAIALDSSQGNAGWNQAAEAEAGNLLGQDLILQVLAQLESGAATVETLIAAGAYGCPGSASCAAAQAAAARARALRSQIVTLTGFPFSNPTLPPGTPTASGAGADLRAAIATVSSELQSLGAPGVTTTLPLPGGRMDGADVAGILSGTSFGYEADIPGYTKHPHIGDVELGARFGVLQKPNARLTLNALARLPTGTTDSPRNLVDLGTGDRQTDLSAGLELALDGGAVSLAAAGSLTLQLPGQIVRRVTPPQRPIAFAGTVATLTRDPGDAIWAAAQPALQLARGFRLYGTVSYYSKGTDRYESAGGTAGPSPAVLEQQTSMRSLSVGGGIAYRGLGRENGFPVEAGVSFQRAISGSGGFTPKATVITMYLRWYHRLWGSAGTEAPALD